MKRIIKFIVIISILIVFPGNICLAEITERLIPENKNLRMHNWEMLCRNYSLMNIKMNETCSKGWAVGEYGEILFYNGKKWQRDEQAGKVTTKWLTSIWMKEDSAKGWAVGEEGEILVYDGNRWKRDVKAENLTEHFLYSLWMNEAGTQGWAVGEEGEILFYDGNRWRRDVQAENLTEHFLYSLWMNEAGTKGWAVGEKGEILFYDGKIWQRIQQDGKITTQSLYSLRMNKEFTKGLAVGEDGEIIVYDGTGWQRDKQAGNVTAQLLNSFWMNEEGTKGWAVGNRGEILVYDGNQWHKDDQSGKLTEQLLISLWMNKTGTKGWIVGGRGEILSYDENRWQLEEKAFEIKIQSLNSLWLNEAGTQGWAVGEKGEILVYDGTRWKKNVEAGKVTTKSLISLWMSKDGSKGWAVGDEGEILLYDNTRWKKDKQAKSTTTKILYSLTMDEDSSQGWAMGEKGEILFYDGNRWKKDMQAGKLTTQSLNSLWINKGGSKGWAVGTRGEILVYDGIRWKKDTEAGKLTTQSLISLWMNKDGSKGWAVGSRGEILVYGTNKWQKDKQAEEISKKNLYAVRMNEEGLEGWIVGGEGEILFYDGKRWQKDVQTKELGSILLTDLWIKNDGTEGWAVGDYGAILRFSPRKLENVTLSYIQEEDLNTLSGEFTLNTDYKIENNPVIKLVSEGLAPVTISDRIDWIGWNNEGKTFQFTFKKIDEEKAYFKNKMCCLEFELNYWQPSNPIRAVYKTKPFKVIGPPGWEKYLVIPIIVLVLNILLVLGAAYNSWIRRIVLSPVGSAFVGLIIGKYLVIDFLIRFVKPIRLKLFRDYRKNLKKASYIEYWQSKTYIPPRLELAGKPLADPKRDDELYKQVLKQLLREPKRQLWLLKGESGVGKTALLENWVKVALELKETPIFIPLGSDSSPQEEAHAILAQYGDIDVKPEIAFDLLKSGGFLIFLDAFNEDLTPCKTKEFVRQVSIRNHVVMTSQFNPRWENFLKISRINLELFGLEQLVKIVPQDWAEKLLNSEYLKDLARLPQTAELLAIYINKNHKFPDLRLDIFRNLVNGLESRYNDELLNLERISWELFRKNEKPIEPNNTISLEFCETAVDQGILTIKERKYLFRHELIHRFFIANYLWRQDPQPIQKWHEQVEPGLGKEYWSKILEFLGEMYAEQAAKATDATFEVSYYIFLEDVVEFSIKIFAERLFPQLERLYRLKVLKKNEEFIFWSAKKLAEAAVMHR